MKKVHSSAVVIIPPTLLYPPIQTIREKYDKSYVRWMPHINLIYPFYEDLEFENVLPQLEEKFQRMSPFPIRFAKFSYFQHSPNSSTVWLKPEAEDGERDSQQLLNLQRELELLFPDCNDLSSRSDEGFIPHLSVGQFKSERHTKQMLDEFQGNWEPATFMVDYVYLISRRGDDPFVIRKAIPLGHPLQPPEFEVVPVPVPTEVMVKLFLTNIDFSIKNSKDLSNTLEASVPCVENVTLVTDNRTKASKGFGFAEVPLSQFEDSFRALNSLLIGQRTLTVKIAEQKKK